MIARLRGTAVASTAEGLVLDVNGVGYLVAATPSALRKAAAGGEVTVETYLHVREDAPRRPQIVCSARSAGRTSARPRCSRRRGGSSGPTPNVTS